MLFPHVHTNRAASIVYDPDSFVDRLDREMSFDQPSFVAVHFTLPHWPYTWATSPTDELMSPTIDLYNESIRRADQQFGDLMLSLERKGALENALVIALSDHGEAFGDTDEFFDDAFTGQDADTMKYQQWGHGTSVFSPQQYRVLLAFRPYGAAGSMLGSPGVRTYPVSLVDLAPTVLDLLGIETGENFDGITLAPLLQAEATRESQPGDRIRFTESEYNPQGFDPKEFSTSQLASAAMVYRLDPSTDRIMVREELLDTIMSSRQYAALLGDRAMGAAVPGLRDDGRHQFVYIETNPASAAREPDDPARLAAALREQYGIDMAVAP
jgi:hypothetical protein